MCDIKNKIALVTGAASGIGAATASLFIKHGATVILTDINDNDGQHLAGALGDNAHYHHLDVSNENHWQALISWIDTRWGRLDILFNNAGVTGLEFGPQDPEHSSLEDWHRIHAINLDGIFLGCKHGISLMKRHGGSIINMSSRSGLVGIPAAAAYSSSKAAIHNYSKTVALYCANQDYNIRCNTVLPGAILTPIWDAMLGDTPQVRDAALQAIADGIPLGHMGEANDVAEAVLFLASDASKYMTGSDIVLDGGILAGATSAPGKLD